MRIGTALSGLAKELRKGVSSRLQSLDAVKRERVSEQAVELRDLAVGLTRMAEAKRQLAVGTLGATERGRRLGQFARRYGGKAASLPVLSIVSDAINERSGVVAHRAALQGRPEGLFENLWLGEALLAAEADRALYAAAQTAMNPQSLVTREAMKSISTLGAEAKQSPSSQYLQRARVLSLRSLQADEGDGIAWHVLSRVYLAQKEPELAIEPAKRAVLGTANPGLALVTLARAYLAAGLIASARRAAELSIEEHCSLGYEVLAELVFLEDIHKTTAARLRAFERHRNQITDADLKEYYGTCRSGSAIARGIWLSQWSKTRASSASVRSSAQLVLERTRGTRGHAAAGTPTACLDPRADTKGGVGTNESYQQTAATLVESARQTRRWSKGHGVGA